MIAMKIKKAALLFLSALILAGIVIYLNPLLLAETIAGADPLLILAAFAVSNAALLSRIVKWKVLLSGVSVAEAAPVQLFGIAVSNLTPGKIGEPVKSVALKMLKNIPVSTSLSTIMWERIMDVLVMVMFGVAGFYLIASTGLFYIVGAAVGLFIVIIAFLVAMLCSERIGRKAFGILRRLPGLGRINDQFLSNFYSGSRISVSRFALCFVFTFFAWLFDGICFYLVFMAISPAGLGFEFPVIITCLLSLSILVGLLSSLPGGAGGTEAVMILLLGALGFQAAVAGSVVLVGRFLTFGYSIIAGYFAFLYLGRRMDVRALIKL
jgi:uncharacterized protein (TIRG00374 family)